MSNNIIQLNQDIVHKELKGLVTGNVEEALNAVLDQEGNPLINTENMDVLLM